MVYPTVNRKTADDFLTVYDLNGLKMLFDGPTRQVMVDFANVVLRSYVDDLVRKAYEVKKAKIAAAGLPQADGAAPTQAVAVTPVPPSAPQKSSNTSVLGMPMYLR